MCGVCYNQRVSPWSPGLLLLTAALLAPRLAAAPIAPITHGPRGAARVALTFDACMTAAMARGLDPHYNHAVIAELRRTRTPATLFLSGLWIERNPAVAAELARDPLFELQNHGQSHRSFRPRCFGLIPVAPSDAGETQEAAEALEIDLAQRLLRGLGVTPRFFRPAGGCTTPRALRLLAARGLRPLGWDLYGADGRNPDAAAIARTVLRGVKPGSIVLLHMNGAPQAPATAQALPLILQGLRTRGLTPVRVSELLGPGQESP